MSVIAERQGLDLSPAARFKQKHVRAEEEPNMRYLPLRTVDADPVKSIRVSIGDFCGPLTDDGWIKIFNTHAEATVAFNAKFKEWCEALPDGAELYWRRHAMVICENNFETDKRLYRAGCRVTAMPPWPEEHLERTS